MKSNIYNIEQIKKTYKRLRIPTLQRDYVWKKAELEKLWDDILNLYKNIMESDNAENSQHFMGILTLDHVTGEELFDVIDGQQRLTTLTVLSDVLSDLIKYSNDGNSIYKHTGLGIEIENIKADGRNTDVLNNDINEDKDPYIRTYNIFSDLYSAAMGSVNPGVLLQIIDKRLFFSVNETDTEQNPNDEFENINATGKPLIFSDLLLNYLIELGGTDKEGNTLSPEYIRSRWNEMLQSIYKEELPEDDETDIDDEDDIYDEDDIDDETVDVHGETKIDIIDTKEESDIDLTGSQEVFKPLKFKKFLNMICGLTDPRSKGMGESIDEFEDAFRRIKVCFPDNDNRDHKDAGFIINAICKYAGFYTLYLNPDKNRNASYSKNLNYLRCINRSKIVPAIIRALSNNDFSEKDLDDLFHAMTTSILLKKIYVERDNKKDLNKKLAFADFIYASLPEKSYEKMLYALDDMDRFKGLIKDDEEKLNDISANLTFWKCNFSNSFNKTLLSVITDRQTNDPGKICMPYSDYDVVPLIDIKTEPDYKKYGFDENNIGELWNMILVKKGEQAKSYDKNKERRREDLTKYFKLFTDYCFDDSFDYKNTVSDKERVIPFICLEYDKYGKFICLTKPFDNDGKKIKADKQHYIYSIYFIKDENNDTDQNFGTIIAEPDFPETRNETLKYCVSIQLKDDAEPSCIDTSSEEFDKFVSDKDIDDYDFNTDDDKKNFGLQLFIETAVQIRALSCNDLDRARQEVYECICRDIEEHKDSPTSLPFFTKEYHDYIYQNNLITDKANDKWNRLENTRNYKIKLEDGSLPDNRIIYINNYTGDVVITKGLRRIYSLFSNTLGIRFGFWLEMKKGEIHYVGCTRKLTKFRNIGDKKLYEKQVLDKDFVSSEDINAENRNIPDCKPYINTEMVRIFNIKERSFDFEDLYIPEYQRGYVWSKENWESLWNKISEEENCDFGNIIFYKSNASNDKNPGRLIIVDGQQRITTIFMILCVHLKMEFDTVFKKLVSMHSASGEASANISESDKKNYQKAFNFFKERFAENNTQKIIGNIASACFNVLTISANAPSSFQYNVFTSINGKGKKLTTAEKIKNHLNKLFPNDTKKIESVVSFKGFTKAYVEMKRKKHIPESLLYAEFCKLTDSLDSIDDLYKACNVYRFIKTGKGALNCQIPIFKVSPKDTDHKMLFLWLEMYRHLKVNTADSLLLYKLLTEEDEERLITLLRRLSSIYFLLYTDDPKGNSRKSINSKLPELADIDPSDLSISTSIAGKEYNLIDDGVLKQGSAFDHADYLWEKLTSLDLTRSTRKNVARTILFLAEIWNGLPLDKAFEMIRPRKSGTSFLYDTDIEHIYPANPVTGLKLPEGFDPPEYLFRLQNVCLLESSINRKVSNGMLLSKGGKVNDKDICFKLGLYTDDEKGYIEKPNTYAKSRYPMAQAFYIMNNEKIISVNPDYILDDKNELQGLYGNIQAEKRMQDLKLSILGQGDDRSDSLFLKMMDEVKPKR